MKKQGCFDAMGGGVPLRQDEKGYSRRRNKQRQNVRAKTVRCTGETGRGTRGTGSNIHRTQAHGLSERSSLDIRHCKVVGTMVNRNSGLGNCCREGKLGQCCQVFQVFKRY